MSCMLQIRELDNCNEPKRQHITAVINKWVKIYKTREALKSIHYANKAKNYKGSLPQLT